MMSYLVFYPMTFYSMTLTQSVSIFSFCLATTNADGYVKGKGQSKTRIQNINPKEQ
jgi:hypothetical protein